MLLAIGVGDVDGAVVHRRMHGHQAVVRGAAGQAQRQVGKLRRIVRRTAQAQAQRVGAHDGEAQRRAILGHAVQRAAVGPQQPLGGLQNAFEQAVDVTLARQRGANAVQLLQPLQQVLCRIHGAPLPWECSLPW